MSIDYDAVIGVGLEFSGSGAALKFLEEQGVLSADDLVEIEDIGLDDWLYDNKKVTGGTLNHYSGYGYFIGHEIEGSNPARFKQSFEEGLARWAATFPSVEAEIIKTVRVS